MLFRNRITGLLFGKYDLKKIASENLIKTEQLVEAVEIIYYDPVLYTMSLISLLLTIGLSIIIHPIAILGLLLSVYLVYLGSSLEIIILSPERLIIDRRTVVEKLFRTNNLRSINLDQISVISYARAPFNIPALILGVIILVIGFILSVNLDSPGIDLNLLLLFSLISSIYLIWFSLRLYKRSLELYVVGVPRSIGIGREKGVPINFAKSLKEIVFERIHHGFHDGNIEVDISEYPLEYSGILKELIKILDDPSCATILVTLDKQPMNTEELIESLQVSDPENFVQDLAKLESDQLIVKNGQNWELNTSFILNKKALNDHRH